MFVGHPLSCLTGTCGSSVYSWMRPGCEKRGLWCDGSWVWWSSWAKYFCVPKDLISRENCNSNRRQGAPGSCWKRCIPTSPCYLGANINPEPSCSSQWPLAGHGSNRVKQIKEGRETVKGAGCPYHCSNWTNNAKYLCSWSQEQSCFWSRETIPA